MNIKKLIILLVFTSLLIFSCVSKLFFNDFQNGWDAYVKKDYKIAYELWLPLAEQSNSKAQFFLGFMHDLGFGTPEDDKEAVKWYQLAAEQGDSRAQLFTGFIYDFGRGVAKDSQEAFKWYQLAAKGGYHEARTKIYDLAAKSIPQALEVLVDDAKNSIAKAQLILASMYANGQGVPQNFEEAMKLYNQLASRQDSYLTEKDVLKLVNKNDFRERDKIALDATKGIVKAQYTLGIMYTKGHGVLKNRSKADKWYRLAKAQEHKAKTNIYNLAKRNSPEAMEVLIEDAERSIAEAQLALGNMYANGNGILKDRNKANKWYRLADAQEHQAKTNIYNLAKKNDLQAIQVLIDDAEKGIAEAQFVLASMYAKGQGVPQNYQEAIKWYSQLAEKQGTNQEETAFYYNWRKSNIPQVLKFLTNDAENGIAKAQNNLGMIYAHGQYVSKDDQQAFKWYRLAAENGSFKAQYNLGEIYAKGQGVPQNYQEAIKWFQFYIEGCRGKNKYIEPMKKECLSGI